LITMSQTEKSKPKRVRKEEQLYEPILNALKRIFEEYVNSHVESVRKRMTEPLPFNLKAELEKACVHFEITAKGHFSEKLKEELDDKALNIIRVEKFSPDIMGFIRKGIPSSSTELITVEVKTDKITIKNISRAKLYKDIFKAHYGMLISPKRIPEEIRRFIADRDDIRGKLIIAQFDETNRTFCFHPSIIPLFSSKTIQKTNQVLAYF